jgi:hypothetical protein
VQAALLGFVADGFAPVNLSTSPEPTLAPLFNIGFYRIVQNGGVVVYVSFDEFRLAVAQRTATSTVARVSALGNFDAGTQAFSALTSTVVLN